MKLNVELLIDQNCKCAQKKNMIYHFDMILQEINYIDMCIDVILQEIVYIIIKQENFSY